MVKNCPLTGSHTQTWLTRSRKGTFSDPPPENEPPARLWSVSGVFLGCFCGERGRGLLSAVSVSEWA